MASGRIVGLLVFALTSVLTLSFAWEFWLHDALFTVGASPAGHVLATFIIAMIVFLPAAGMVYRGQNELLRRQESLRESEERYRSLVEQSPSAILVHKRGTIVYANQAAGQLLAAKDNGDLIGIGILCLIHPDDQGHAAERLHALWDGREDLPPTEMRLVRLDGEVARVSVASGATRFMGQPAQQSVIRDVTERRRTEDLLRVVAEGVSGSVGESFFQSLVKYLAETLEADYAFVGEVAGDGRSINAIAVHGYGSPLPPFSYRMEGTPCMEVVGRETCFFERHVRQKFPQDTLLARLKAESYVGTPLFDAQGRALGILVVIHSSSLADHGVAVSLLQIFAQRAAAELERARVEEAVAESEERFRSLASSASDAIISADGDGNVVFWNRGAEAMFGYEEDEVLGRPITILMPERYREAHTKGLVSMAESGRPGRAIGRSIEVEGLRRNGGEFPIELSISSWTSARGRFFSAIIRDISQRRQTEEQLRKLSRAVEQSPVSVIITDPKGTIEYVNPRFVETSGYAADEVVGRNPRVLKSGDMSPDQYRDMWETLKRGETWRGEFHNRRKDGSLYWESASISPVRGVDGRVTHFIAVKEDISERRHYEEDLRSAKEQAEFASRAKTEFLANMSHELRTPLNSIIGFSDILVAESFGPIGQPQYKEYVKDINDSGKHLLDLINDLLDIARIETGDLRLYERNVDVAALVGGCQRLISERAQRAGLTLDVSLPPDTPAMLADERKLKQILLNLLSNAVKFTDAGGRVELSARIGDDGGYLFTVSDNGIGIQASDIPLVLSVFGQADGSLARRYEGAGLGLPLSKNLAELHGGSLELESEPGVGTKITVRFPGERTLRPS